MWMVFTRADHKPVIECPTEDEAIEYIEDDPGLFYDYILEK